MHDALSDRLFKAGSGPLAMVEGVTGCRIGKKEGNSLCSAGGHLDYPDYCMRPGKLEQTAPYNRGLAPH
jgi:hypothetical protein